MDWNDFERDWEREDKFGDSKRISIKHALHAEHFFMCPLYSEGPETIIHALKKIATDDAKMFTSEIHDPCARTTGAWKQENTKKSLQKGGPVWSRPNTLRRLSQKTLLQL